jgi:hypothetical protein
VYDACFMWPICTWHFVKLLISYIFFKCFTRMIFFCFQVPKWALDQILTHLHHHDTMKNSWNHINPLSRSIFLFCFDCHRACKFNYLQAHHQFYRPEFENYINDHKIIKPPKLKTWWCTKYYDIDSSTSSRHNEKQLKSHQPPLKVHFFILFWLCHATFREKKIRGK